MMAVVSMLVISVMSIILLAILDSIVYSESFWSAVILLFTRTPSRTAVIMIITAIILALLNDIRGHKHIKTLAQVVTRAGRRG